jgi:LAO/AO transport system kinase
MIPKTAASLVDEVLRGSVLATARLITLVEDGHPDAREALRALYPHTGKAYIVGITGSSGSGKSTLVDKVALNLSNENHTVGIVAIDPSSPFTGGALLGDRVRMQGADAHDGIFIRSLSTRGMMGGLSRTTADIVKIMDAMGKDFILVETIGVGQDEVSIAEEADTTVLIMVPGLGDDIQSIKAGIMEIADIFVVNKCDREGAEAVVSAIRLSLEMAPVADGWSPPIVKTVATLDEGVGALVEQLRQHRKYLEESGELAKKRRERIRSELIRMVDESVFRFVAKQTKLDESFEEVLEDVVSRKKDPYSCVDRIREVLESRLIGKPFEGEET